MPRSLLPRTEPVSYTFAGTIHQFSRLLTNPGHLLASSCKETWIYTHQSWDLNAVGVGDGPGVGLGVGVGLGFGVGVGFGVGLGFGLGVGLGLAVGDVVGVTAGDPTV